MLDVPRNAPGKAMQPSDRAFAEYRFFPACVAELGREENLSLRPRQRIQSDRRRPSSVMIDPPWWPLSFRPNDGDSLAGMPALIDLFIDAQTIDMTNAKRLPLGRTGGTVTGYLTAIINVLERVRPSIQIDRYRPRKAKEQE